MSSKGKQKKIVTKTPQSTPLEVNCEEQSIAFAKSMAAIAVSNILLLRKFFTKDYYENRRISGVDCKILKPDSRKKAASQVLEWIQGCFEAINDKFLKELTLTIVNAKPKDEEYTLYVSYDENTSNNLNVSLAPHSRASHSRDRQTTERSNNNTQDPHQSIAQLLINLKDMTKDHSRLPGNSYVTMQLTLNQDAPEDYEPRGFLEADDGICHSVGSYGSSGGRGGGDDSKQVVNKHKLLKLNIKTDDDHRPDTNGNRPDHNPGGNPDHSSHDNKDECLPAEVVFRPNKKIKTEVDVKPKVEIKTEEETEIFIEKEIIKPFKLIPKEMIKKEKIEINGKPNEEIEEIYLIKGVMNKTQLIPVKQEKL